MAYKIRTIAQFPNLPIGTEMICVKEGKSGIYAKPCEDLKISPHFAREYFLYPHEYDVIEER